MIRDQPPDAVSRSFTAWVIVGALLVPNVLLLLLNGLSVRNQHLEFIRKLLSEEMILLIWIALVFEAVPITCALDVDIYGGSKFEIYFRIFRAIYVGLLVNLLLLLLNKTIMKIKQHYGNRWAGHPNTGQG